MRYLIDCYNDAPDGDIDMKSLVRMEIIACDESSAEDIAMQITGMDSTECVAIFKRKDGWTALPY